MYCVYRSHNWRLESASNPRHRRYSSQSPVTNHLGVSSRLAAAHHRQLGAHTTHTETRHPSASNQCVTTVRPSAGDTNIATTLTEYLEMKIKLLHKKQDYQQTIEYLLHNAWKK